jgi:hypothetical protein
MALILWSRRRQAGFQTLNEWRWAVSTELEIFRKPPVAAQESGEPDLCAVMALHSVDLMLDVTFRKGHFLGLDKALIGAGIEGKAHNVTLNDGSLIADMGGAKAPTLWAQGEYSAVLAYLTRDVTALLDLADWIQEHKSIQWTSGSGRGQFVGISEFHTVRELFGLPEPDTSWMTNPPQRRDFVSWMPADVIASLVPEPVAEFKRHLAQQYADWKQFIQWIEERHDGI